MSRKLLSNLPSDNISITIFTVEASAEKPHLFISSMSSTEMLTSPSRRCALMRVLYGPLSGAIPSSSIFLSNSLASDSDPFLHSPPASSFLIPTIPLLSFSL
ncbi:hypothetical protein BRARA_I05134 [Brassica rapa]|uniref:Uncharacterized protein n=1 Tax=Brassica campestris TaxID=3711 RepID=A0A397YCB7_BRACM|nr:hypothetical protein BRARA_I05134 [Brassica rapa]